MKRLLSLFVALIALSGSALAADGNYPTKPVRIIVPTAPGGGVDVLARLVGQKLGDRLGEQFFIDNRPGAAGVIGTRTAATSAPDGYTLLMAPSSLAITAAIKKKLPYDLIHDLTPVMSVASTPYALIVNPALPVHSVQELIAYAKANPDKITYGTPGTGTTPHLAVEQFALEAGIKLTHIPFKGFAENMQSLLGGHTMALSDSTGWAPHVDSGKARLLATYGSKRTKRWPQVPTLLDAGYQTVSDSPYGFGGPKGMDPKVVKILHDAFRKAMDDPKVLAMLEKFDQPLIYMNGEDYTKFAKKTMAEEKPLIERLGMSVKN